MPTIQKPVHDIDSNDVALLVSEEWGETELLELKETLSTSGRGTPDPWLIDQSEVGQSAKRDVLAEVVAMANSYGGDVILGVEERDDKPPRAKAVKPLPKCIELAHRFEMFARDLIKPEIPMLSVRGVPVEGDSGIVIFRVPRSRLAPHRLEMKNMVKECYKRVSDRTEPMSMREIQDLTFAVARGLQAVDARFKELHGEFVRWSQLDSVPTSWRRQGFRVSCVPVSGDIGIEVPNPEMVVYGSLNLKIGQGTWKFGTLADPYEWRPILRGIRGRNAGPRKTRSIELFANGVLHDAIYLHSGLVDGQGAREEFGFHPGWLFASVCGALFTIERIRRTAGAHGVLYGLELELGTTDAMQVYHLDTSWRDIAGTVLPGLYPFPRYQIGERDTWNDTLTLIWRDFWNFIGISADERIELI